jgi:predicted nucleic acid-binding protein
LDTNILVYATDLSNQFHQESLKVVLSARIYYLVDRSLLEFYRAVTGPLRQKPELALEWVSFFQNNSKFIILNSTDFSNQLTFKLAELNLAMSGRIFDLNILSMAMENEIDVIYTKNTKDYPTNKKVKIVDPTV